MKKVLFLAAATAAVLSSCSKNEVVESKLDNQQLGFGVYTGTSVKSGASDEMTTAGLATTGFGVFAYYDQPTAVGGTAGAFTDASTPDFMYNTKVSGTEVAGTPITYTWTYSPMKYWPNNTNDVLSFFAYGPHSTNSSDASGISFDAVDDMVGIPVLTYTIQDADALVDFVAAAPQYNLQNETEYNEKHDDVSLTFKHLLTRAKFQAYIDVTDFKDVNDENDTTTENPNDVDDTETKVYVNKMVIIGSNGTTTNLVDKTNTVTDKESAGFYTTAKFKFNASDDTDDTDDDIAGVGSWIYTDATSNTADFDFSDILDATTVKFGEYTPDGVDVEGQTADDATPLFKQADGTAAEKFLFFIPPTSEGIVASTGDMYLYIEYSVVTLDGDLGDKYNEVVNKDVITLAPGTLKPGVAYNYTLVIGLDEVTLTAEVAGWGNETPENIVTPE